MIGQFTIILDTEVDRRQRNWSFPSFRGRITSTNSKLCVCCHFSNSSWCTVAVGLSQRQCWSWHFGERLGSQVASQGPRQVKTSSLTLWRSSHIQSILMVRPLSPWTPTASWKWSTKMTFTRVSMAPANLGRNWLCACATCRRWATLGSLLWLSCKGIQSSRPSLSVTRWQTHLCSCGCGTSRIRM